MILDTNFLSYLIDEDEDAWEKAMEISDEDFEKCTTPVVLFELYYGAFFDENPELIRKVANIESMYEVKGMSDEDVIEGAERLANADLAEDDGSGVEPEDGMIAGVAANNDEVVLTANAEDFRKLNVEVDEFSPDSR